MNYLNGFEGMRVGQLRASVLTTGIFVVIVVNHIPRQLPAPERTCISDPSRDAFVLQTCLVSSRADRRVAGARRGFLNTPWGKYLLVGLET
jgi:hypothetical protein